MMRHLESWNEPSAYFFVVARHKRRITRSCGRKFCSPLHKQNPSVQRSNRCGALPSLHIKSQSCRIPRRILEPIYSSAWAIGTCVHAEGRIADFSPGPKPMQGSASPIVIQATPAFRKSHNRQTNASSNLHLNPLSCSKPMSMYVFPQSMAQSSPKRLMTRVMFVWSHPKLSLSLQQRVEWFQTIGCVSI